MESGRIEKLLNTYFEGNTTLSEEATLRTYFTGMNVEPHLQKYQPLFIGLKAAKSEVSQKEIIVTNIGTNRNWLYAIAASVVIAISVAGYMFSESSISAEEKQALMAFNESKKAMLLLSENFNKGASHLALVNQFTETKNRILK